MRIPLPPELEEIGKEVDKYFDYTQPDFLRADTPPDIREKAMEFRRRANEIYEAAERAELEYMGVKLPE